MSTPKTAKKAPRKPAKASGDVNQNAFRLVQEATGQAPKTAPPEKNPAAVALGKLGGLKGGKARAAALTKKERSEIARVAASARWKKSEK